jgi:hypothetical protein
MANVILIRGTHGTSVSRVTIIQKEGFKTTQGRLGQGAYFWSDGPFAEYLANSWWKYQQAKGKFAEDTNQDCGLVLVELKIEEQYFLDLNDKEIKDGLAQLCMSKNIRYKTSTREVAATIACFVSELEKELGHKFKVMESTIAPPPRNYTEKYPISTIGAPNCCIVFDTDCINIISVGCC